MSSSVLSPIDRCDKLEEVASELASRAAVLDLVAAKVLEQRITVPGPPGTFEGYVHLLLTPQIERAFICAVSDLGTAAEAADAVLKASLA